MRRGGFEVKRSGAATSGLPGVDQLVEFVHHRLDLGLGRRVRDDQFQNRTRAESKAVPMDLDRSPKPVGKPGAPEPRASAAGPLAPRRRSGERVRERGIVTLTPTTFKQAPLPGPLPARSSRGEGEQDRSEPRASVLSRCIGMPLWIEVECARGNIRPLLIGAPPETNKLTTLFRRSFLRFLSASPPVVINIAPVARIPHVHLVLLRHLPNRIND